MATRTIAAMFDRYDDAADAVRRLEGAGVAHSDISIVSNDDSHAEYRDAAGGHVSGTGTGASLGTLLGGGAGLLAGLGMLAIPGLGPVVAAGWLASTLLGAGIGAAAGGLVGSLTDVGVSETDAHAYAEGVRRGGTLVTVRADDSLTARVTDVLDQNGTIDMDDRTQQWRGEGWSGTLSEPSGTRDANASMQPTRVTPQVLTDESETIGMQPRFGQASAVASSEPVSRPSRVRVYDQR